MNLKGKKYQILVLVFLVINISLVKITPDIVSTQNEPILNPHVAADSPSMNYVDSWFDSIYGTTMDFPNMQENNDDFTTVMSTFMSPYLAEQIYEWNESDILYNWDDVFLCMNITSNLSPGQNFHISVSNADNSWWMLLGSVDSSELDYRWNVTGSYKPFTKFYAKVYYSTTDGPGVLEIERMYLECIDNTNPTWNKGGSFPAENQWYSQTPVLPLTFEDNTNLDEGWWNWEGHSPDLLLFENWDTDSWSNGTWEIPNAEWLTISDGEHNLTFQVYDDFGNYQNWTWAFNKDITPPDPPPHLNEIDSPGTYGDIELVWNSVTDDSPISSYNIYRDTQEITSTVGLEAINSTTSTDCIDSGLIPGTYYYVVTANSTGGESLISNCQSVVVPVPPEGTIIVITPTGSTKFQTGKSHTIEWESMGDIENVKIQLYWQDFKVRDISSFTENDGEYSWYIYPTQPPSDSFRIRIEDATNSSVYHYSPDFEIYKNSLSIDSPVESDTLQAGNSYYINWTYTGYIDEIDIKLYRDGTYLFNIDTEVSNNGVFEWAVPEKLSSSTKYQITIEDSSESTTLAWSEEFEIKEKPIWKKVWFWTLVLGIPGAIGATIGIFAAIKKFKKKT